MKKSWIINLILFCSLGMNAFAGAMVAGRALSPSRPPASTAAESQPDTTPDNPPRQMTFQRLSRLPEDERTKAMATFRKVEPQLRTTAQSLRQSRHDAFSYLLDPAYTRAEADRRFTEMREKTMEALIQTQDLILDIADTLPPAERKHLIPRLAAMTNAATGTGDRNGDRNGIRANQQDRPAMRGFSHMNQGRKAEGQDTPSAPAGAIGTWGREE